jgi:hypothetical protein
LQALQTFQRVDEIQDTDESPDNEKNGDKQWVRVSSEVSHFELLSENQYPLRVAGMSLRFPDMGLKALWIAFGAAAFYVVAALAVPTVIVVLRERGVEIGAEAATNITRLTTLLASPLGGVLGLRHAQRLKARRGET